MSIRDLVAEDMANLVFNVDGIAEAAVYIDVSTGTSVACNVIVEHGAMVQLDGYETGVQTIGTAIEAMYSDVGKPKNNSIFEVDGITYKVRGIEECDRITTRMKVVPE